jgi:acetolactate synthase-1/3 small subunit
MVVDFREGSFIDRELILIKVTVTPKTRKELLEAIDSFGARIENAGSKSLSIEATGEAGKIHGLLELLRPFGILEVVRTGRIAMSTEDKGLAVRGKPEVNE